MHHTLPIRLCRLGLAAFVFLAGAASPTVAMARAPSLRQPSLPATGSEPFADPGSSDLELSAEPQIAIINPQSGAVVTLGLDGYESVPISFTVANFTLQVPGSCGTDPRCGHVHLGIDGANGNGPGLPYNDAGITSPLDARYYWLDYNGFDSTGLHLVTLGLYDDNHMPILVNGAPVEARVYLFSRANSNPSISIVRPGNGSTVRLGTDVYESVPISFKVDHFQLADPGTCGSRRNCGHVHLLIDGTHGNQPALPYNNMGATSPLPALFSYLAGNGYPDISAHRIGLELHYDDHTPVQLPNADGTWITVGAWVTVTAVAP